MVATEQTQERMVKAKKLIQAKRYDDARKILRSVNHPTAKKWLAKIDELDLGDPFDSPEEKPTYITKFLLAFLCLFLFFVPGLIMTSVFGNQAKRDIKRYGADNVVWGQAMVWLNKLTLGVLALILVGLVVLLIVIALQG